MNSHAVLELLEVQSISHLVGLCMGKVLDHSPVLLGFLLLAPTLDALLFILWKYITENDFDFGKDFKYCSSKS